MRQHDRQQHTRQDHLEVVLRAHRALEDAAQRRQQDDQADHRVDCEGEAEVEVDEVGVGGDRPVARHGGIHGAEEESVEDAAEVDAGHRHQVTEQADDGLQDESDRVGDRVCPVGECR